MKISNNKKVNKILIYFFIITIIYLSGNIFFMSIHYSKSVTIVAIFSILMLFIFRLEIKEYNLKSILFTLLLIICMLITLLINIEPNISPYIAITLQIFIAYSLSKIITFSEFKKIYVKVITYLAIISLICFLVSKVYPSIVYMFPKTDAIASVDYYNAFVYVFHAAIGYGELVLSSRNSGIFWEPGAYQAFLNIGIYFLIDLHKSGYKFKFEKYIILILIITVLTTYSTNGYMITALVVLSNIKIMCDIFIKSKKDIVITLGICLIVAIVIVKFEPNNIDIGFNIYDKISSEFSNGGEGALERISLDKLKYIFYDNKINFFGMSFSQFSKLKENCWNSIIHTMITLGIPFTTLILIGYYNSANKLIYKPILFLIVLIMCFSTETLFWRPMFIYFIFAGINSRKQSICNENIYEIKFSM